MFVVWLRLAFAFGFCTAHDDFGLIGVSCMITQGLFESRAGVAVLLYR
jgi:hypothetical protein